MVRGITSRATNGTLLLVTSFLAEMTAAGFFEECFKGCNRTSPLDGYEKEKIVYALGTLALVAETGQGWQLVPYIDGEAIARMDGKYVPMYKPRHGGDLKLTEYTDEVEKRLPDRFTLPGWLYSNLPEMQTKGLVMTEDMLNRLLTGRAPMSYVIEEVKLINLKPRQYIKKFNDIDPKVKSEESEYVALDNAFTFNDAYRFVQGPLVSASEPVIENPVECLLGALMVGCAMARFKNRQQLPPATIRSVFDSSHKMRVITMVSNENKSPKPYSLLKTNLSRCRGLTDDWFEYVKLVEKDESAPLWRLMRPLFAVAKGITVDYVHDTKDESFAKKFTEKKQSQCVIS